MEKITKEAERKRAIDACTRKNNRCRELNFEYMIEMERNPVLSIWPELEE